jgi:hypothetical protein
VCRERSVGRDKETEIDMTASCEVKKPQFILKILQFLNPSFKSSHRILEKSWILHYALS